MQNEKKTPAKSEGAENRMIDRRTLLRRSGIVAATSALVMRGNFAVAQSSGDKSWNANGSLIEAALECAKQSEACLAHCISSFKDGSTMLAECAGLVLETSTVCPTLVTLASNGSDRLRDMARLTIASCTACEKECRLHASHHEECKACADSCVACIEEIRSFLG